MAVPCSRLRTFRPEPCGTPRREGLTARGQRCPAASAATERHGIPLAQPDGSRFVCASSDECGVRGVGGRAEKRVEHAVFPARALCLHLVRTRTGAPPVRRSGFLLCPKPAREAAGGHISLSAPTVGLLAAPPNGCRGRDGASGRRAQIVERKAATGKVAAPAALRSERGGNAGGPAGR